jgi:hypothetical protein
MKKVIMVIAALVLVLSGVAAVSAYEAHIVNVKAHLENAMLVDRVEIDYGTVFPEEWMVETFTVGVSSSFCAIDQTRVNTIDYSVWVEWKPETNRPFAYWDGSDWVASTDFYNWIGYFTYVGIDVAPNPLAADLTLVGDPPSGVPGTSAKVVIANPVALVKGVHPIATVSVGIDVPVFEGFYNPLTDLPPKPSGEDTPTYTIPAAMPGFDPSGMDFGLDLKIQITDIYKQ